MNIEDSEEVDNPSLENSEDEEEQKNAQDEEKQHVEVPEETLEKLQVALLVLSP